MCLYRRIFTHVKNSSMEDSEDRDRGKMRFNGFSLVKYLQRISWVKDRYTKWVHIKSVSANAVVNHNERLAEWKSGSDSEGVQELL